MKLYVCRQFNGYQIDIESKNWSMAMALFCKGKVIGLLPCSKCNRYICKRNFCILWSY